MPRLTSQDWVRAAAGMLAEHGVEGLRVEPLARRLGVSKGSFYWHFADRNALLATVLSDWEARGTEAIIAAIDEHDCGADERLWRLMERVFGGPLLHDQFETAIRAWGTQDPAVGATIDRVDQRRLGYVARLLTDAGVGRAEAKRRAQILYATLVGEFFMRSHGGSKLPQATLRSLHRMLLAGP
ncbi:MAG: TetR/AcrR family transcriptional regulator [Myxococcales bacterium]|nr:TetR/AcrR family transcriptional regulator [Myxococcales bacterium]